VAPTATQAVNDVGAIVTWLDADLTAIVTHNFGLTATQNTQLFPIVIVNIDSTSTGTANPTITVTRSLNNITLTKVSAAGSGGTLAVTCLRPFEPTK